MDVAIKFIITGGHSLCANFLQHVLCTVLVDLLPYSDQEVRCPTRRLFYRPDLFDVVVSMRPLSAISHSVILPVVPGQPSHPRVLREKVINFYATRVAISREQLHAAPGTHRRTIAGRRSTERVRHQRPSRLCVAAWASGCRWGVGDIQNLVYLGSHVQEPLDFRTHFGELGEIDLTADQICEILTASLHVRGCAATHASTGTHGHASTVGLAVSHWRRRRKPPIGRHRLGGQALDDHLAPHGVGPNLLLVGLHCRQVLPLVGHRDPLRPGRE